MRIGFFVVQTTYRPERVTRHYLTVAPVLVGGDERCVVGDVLIPRLLNAHAPGDASLGTISQNLIVLTASLPYLYVTLCLPFSTLFLTQSQNKNKSMFFQYVYCRSLKPPSNPHPKTQI
jgi:hypothetical protein